jgi:hypothetical protein
VEVQNSSVSTYSRQGGRAITICEGALDAPSAWLLLGSRYPVVSVISAAGAFEQCKAV